MSSHHLFQKSADGPTRREEGRTGPLTLGQWGHRMGQPRRRQRAIPYKTDPLHHTTLCQQSPSSAFIQRAENVQAHKNLYVEGRVSCTVDTRTRGPAAPTRAVLLARYSALRSNELSSHETLTVRCQGKSAGPRSLREYRGGASPDRGWAQAEGPCLGPAVHPPRVGTVPTTHTQSHTHERSHRLPAPRRPGAASASTDGASRTLRPHAVCP